MENLKLILFYFILFHCKPIHKGRVIVRSHRGGVGVINIPYL